MALRIVANRPDPAVLTLPWATALQDWDEELRRPAAAWPVAPHRADHPAGRARSTRSRRRRRRWRCASTGCCATCSGSGLPAVVPQAVVTGRADADGAGAAGGAAHPAPPVLPALPQPVLPRHHRHGRAVAGRRDGGAPGAAAPRGLLLGRRVAVERAVPPRRRRVRGVPRRRRDRRAAPPPLRPDAGVRPHRRHRERLRRAARPAGQPRGVRRGGAARGRRAARRSATTRCGPS